METFAISPDDCLVLKAFRDSESLREAANLLNCDPAGLARRVQAISRQHGFLQKVNNRWRVTSRGLQLVAWVEESIQSQKKTMTSKNNFHIASYVWLIERQMIPNLSELKKTLSASTSFSFSVPENGFERALTGGEVDFAIVCHPPQNPEIEHKKLTAEKWIVVASAKWQKELKGKSIEALANKPFIRHASLNEDLFLPNIQIKDSGITLDSLVAVRAAIKSSLGWSLVPKFLVDDELKQQQLIEVDHELSVHDRNVCVWWLRNRYESKRNSNLICSWVKEICKL